MDQYWPQKQKTNQQILAPETENQLTNMGFRNRKPIKKYWLQKEKTNQQVLGSERENQSTRIGFRNRKPISKEY